MGTHMKTTIEISDALLEAAKQQAGDRATTLRALVEEGLRTVLEEGAGAESGAVGPAGRDVARMPAQHDRESI